MRAVSLRWGSITGVAGAILGLAALVVGAVLEPIKTQTTAETVAFALFVRGLLAFASLGLALGFAYYGGLRVERTRNARATADPQAIPAQPRLYSLAAGGIAMFIYWAITSVYVILQSVTPASPSSGSTMISFLQARAVFGIICVLAGIGLGGIGGRASAAQRLLDQIVVAEKVPASATHPVSTAGEQGAGEDPSATGA
jgi:hypothetical protein